MAHWLLKTEPASYGWADLVRDGKTDWDGVRNPAAAAHLRPAAVTRAAQPQGEDAPVRIAPVAALSRPVTLAAMKAEPALAAMPTLRQPRLSVSPVSDAEWAVLTRMAEA